MPMVEGPLAGSAQKVTGAALQGALVDLLGLALMAKQAHWNVFGAGFRPLHLQLDELASAARDFADDVAERAATIGVSPDGRAVTVAAMSGVAEFPGG